MSTKAFQKDLNTVRQYTISNTKKVSEEMVNSSADTGVLSSIGPGDTTIEISFVAAPAEKPLSLGRLARIHMKGRVPPSTIKCGTLEFLFLQDDKWLKYSVQQGIIPLNDEDFRNYDNPSKYILLGPVPDDGPEKQISAKERVYDFRLYERVSKNPYW